MARYYLLGVKGAGVSAMALFLKDLGNEVIGYDDAEEHRFTEDPLHERNIPIVYDQSVPLDADTTIVFSSALQKTHRELVRAREAGCTIYEYHEMLGILSKKYDTVCVAGCHGKTTTTAMISHILTHIDGCNYIIGDGVGHADPSSEKFILEACEFRRHFLAYFPDYAIVTNIGLDHMDYFKDLEDIKDAFITYANKATKGCIFCGDDENTRSIRVEKPVLYYGFKHPNNDVVAKNIDFRDDGTSFDVYIKGEFYGHFDLELFGEHMLENGLAAITVCYLEGYKAEDVNHALTSFRGAKRRFKEEFFGTNVLVDDYAHHPTEIAVTIGSARQKYPGRPVIAIFKAHTFSRVQDFRQEFIDALNLADKAFVMDINYDREDPNDYPGISAYTIISGLNNGDYIEQGMAEKLLPYENSVILFMSSKEIYLLEEEYKKKKAGAGK